MEYTEREQAAVQRLREMTLNDHVALCPFCLTEGHSFTLGEQFFTNGTVHLVTWVCDRGHSLTCDEFLVEFP